MRNLIVLFIHFIATLARLLGRGGVRSLVAESGMSSLVAQFVYWLRIVSGLNQEHA